MATSETIEQVATDRNRTIALIKAALRRRSGKPWSVTGGRGTSRGWITICAPPARCTWRHAPKQHNINAMLPGAENWDDVDTGRPGGHMSPADCHELASLLGLGYVSLAGVSIPASFDHYREYIERAEGLPVTKQAEPYWD